MKLTDIKNSLNEISAIGGLKQVVKGNTDRVEGIKLSKEMAQAMIDWFNSSPYGRKYPKAAKARLHLSLGIMSSMGLDRYAKHKGAKKELQYIKDLAKAMRDNVNEESLNERDDAGTHLDRLADLVGKAKDFFAIGKELDKGGYKKKYFYSSTMMPMYQIEIDGFKFGIINKKYVDKGDREVGSTAIGLMENLTTEGKDDFNASYSGVNINLKKGYKKHNEDDLMKLYSQIGKAVNRMKGVKSVEVVFEGTINEVKYDIGMARKGNGITVYNRAEEENGDYKNVAHIDNKGKIKYYDKKVPSKVKKEIEAKAKEMMEVKLEGSMKLTDLLNEDVYVKNKETGNVYKVKNANPSKHVPPSKGEVDKAKKDGDGEATPAAPKNVNPEKGKSLEFAANKVEEIVPKSEESQKISADYKKQKEERAAMEKEMDSALDNYLKSKGETRDTLDWSTIDGGFNGWTSSEENKKSKELRDKLDASSDDFYELERKSEVAGFKDLVKGSPEELKARHKELDAEVERLQAEKKKAEEAGDKDAATDAYMAASMIANKRYAVYAKMNGESDNEIYSYMKKEDSDNERLYKKKLQQRNESIREGKRMKLKDILNESFESMKVYSNPFHTPFVKENEMERGEESNEMTTEQKAAFLEAVKSYTSFGETVYRKEGLAKVYESIRNVVELAGKNMVKETEGSFDGITVGRHVKRMNESFKIFEKTLREVHTLQQRLESTYDEIGEVLGKYYEISDVKSNNVEEGNEFGAARAKAIAAGEDSFEVDGKTYPVKSVDKDDKENAKKFANESKSMKLTSMLNESFGYGELPSEKLIKMKVSAKDMMDSVKNKTTKNILEGYSTEEKRIVLLAVRKLMKYKNIDINLAAQYVVGAAQELKMDIDKGRVKK